MPTQQKTPEESVRSLGVEEELLLVDPRSGLPVAVIEQVLAPFWQGEDSG